VLELQTLLLFPHSVVAAVAQSRKAGGGGWARLQRTPMPSIIAPVLHLQTGGQLLRLLHDLRAHLRSTLIAQATPHGDPLRQIIDEFLDEKCQSLWLGGMQWLAKAIPHAARRAAIAHCDYLLLSACRCLLSIDE